METAVKIEEKDKLFNFRPLVFAAVFLALGILFAYYRTLYSLSFWWLCGFIPVAIIPFFLASKKEYARRLLALLMLVFCFACGFVGFRSQTYQYTACRFYSGVYTVTGTVVGKAVYEDGAKLVLEDVFIGENKVEGRLNAYLPISDYQKAHIADVVALRGFVNTKTELLGEYGFRANAIDEEIRYTLRVNDGFAVAGKSKNAFLVMRNKMERVICAGMDATAASVTLAVLTGDSANMESGLLENMRYGGIAHIFAVSGLHVGALYAFCLLLFSRTRMQSAPKPLRLFLVAVILLFYAGVCGFSASILRATVICLVGYFMKLIGTSSDGLSVLGLSALFILLLSPVSLFEVGFQLSFLACIGILLFAKRIGQVCDKGYKCLRKRYPRPLTKEQEEMVKKGDTLPPSIEERCVRNAVSVFSVSLAAQITTAPVSYLAFGYFSGWSFLLNFIFVPLISAMFAFLLLFCVLACLLPLTLAPYLLYLPSVLWNLLLLTFEIVDFSSFALTSMQLSGASCVCYYGGVIFLTDKWNVTKKQSRILSAVFFVGFLRTLTMLNI